MDSRDVMIVVLFAGCIIGLSIIGTYAESFFRVISYHGQRYDVIVTVQAVEHSTRFGSHTNLWGRVYGMQDITYTFIGDIDFEVGKTYHIVFVDRIWFTIFGFEVRGDVLNIEEVS